MADHARPAATPRQRLGLLFTSGKFLLSFLALTGAMIGACWGWLSGGEWVATVNISLAVYAGSNVAATVAHHREGKS